MRVLVTRPEPGAAQTAARLEALGHKPVVAPLSQVAPVAVAALPDAANFDAVALTSANALKHAAPPLLSAISQLPCFTVGDRTAEAAREAGFAYVRSAGGDVNDLASLVCARLKAGSHVLYLTGERRRPVLEEKLMDAGFSVTPLETYRIEAVSYATAERDKLIAGPALDAVLVYSRYGAELLSDFLGDGQNLRVLCMSRQVAEGLSHSLRKSAEIASAPNENALLALLGRAP